MLSNVYVSILHGTHTHTHKKTFSLAHTLFTHIVTYTRRRVTCDAMWRKCTQVLFLPAPGVVFEVCGRTVSAVI